MFERFTDRARKVMALANDEAHRNGHDYIGCEHILLGMAREGSGIGITTLKRLRVEPDTIRRTVEKRLKPGAGVDQGKLPQTPRAKHVIEYAIAVSRSLGHNYVGTEHILLGLLREGGGVTGEVFAELGVTPERTRAQLLELLGENPPRPQPAERVPSAAMKIIRRPSVYLVGRQVMHEAEIDRFLADHDVSHWTTDTEVAGEKLAEVAGRLCYMSFAKPRPGGNTAYLGHIKEVGHGSVMEHAVWNFIITGVSRSFTHELVRHRAGFGYSQLSQRYVDESVAEYVEPDCIADDPELHEIWQTAVGQAHEAYVKLTAGLAAKFADVEDKTLRRKMARQAARSVLPNATETKIFVTANARALRHFIELRCNEHAETEIRIVSGMVLDILAREAPSIFGDYERVDLPDGTRAAKTPHPKV